MNERTNEHGNQPSLCINLAPRYKGILGSGGKAPRISQILELYHVFIGCISNQEIMILSCILVAGHIHLVSCVLNSRPTFLLASNRISVFSFWCSCLSPTN